MSLPAPSLDHLILFLPLSPESRTPTIPTSLSSSFTLTPGGTHADNISTNTLILLADGSYIELISFLSPDPVLIEHHWWGPDPQRKGWTDWCLTTSSPADQNFEDRLAKGGRYAAPRKGGRLRPDGVRVNWAVTFPVGEDGGRASRGRLPFWCHDEPVTARDLRVPISEERVGHSSGVVGVLSVSVVVRDLELLEDTRKSFASIFGQDSGGEGTKGVVFETKRVRDVEGLERGARVLLRVAREEEASRVKERGFWYGDVVFAAKAGDGRQAGERIRIDSETGDDWLGGLWVEYV